MKKYSTRALEPIDESVTLDIKVTCAPHQAQEMKKMLFAMNEATSAKHFLCYVEGGMKVVINEQDSVDFVNEMDMEKDTLEFFLD